MANIELMNAMSSIGEGFLQGINRSKAAERQKMMDQMNMRHAEAKLDLSRQQLAQSGMNARNLDEYRRESIAVQKKANTIRQNAIDAKARKAQEDLLKEQQKVDRKAKELAFKSSAATETLALKNQKALLEDTVDSLEAKFFAKFPDATKKDFQIALEDPQSYLKENLGLDEVGGRGLNDWMANLSELKTSMDELHVVGTTLDVHNDLLSKSDELGILDHETLLKARTTNVEKRLLGGTKEPEKGDDPASGKLNPVKIDLLEGKGGKGTGGKKVSTEVELDKIKGIGQTLDETFERKTRTRREQIDAAKKKVQEIDSKKPKSRSVLFETGGL